MCSNDHNNIISNNTVVIPFPKNNILQWGCSYARQRFIYIAYTLRHHTWQAYLHNNNFVYLLYNILILFYFNTIMPEYNFIKNTLLTVKIILSERFMIYVIWSWIVISYKLLYHKNIFIYRYYSMYILLIQIFVLQVSNSCTQYQ